MGAQDLTQNLTRRGKKLLPDEKSRGLGTQRESRKTYHLQFFSTNVLLILVVVVAVVVAAVVVVAVVVGVVVVV